VNPSSGNLHPTEAYLICPSLPKVNDRPGICHYSPLRHALEKRLDLKQDEWSGITAKCSPETLFVALTSIYWREAWKYGERAFRYCNHDVGHALGAISLAAAGLGWQTRLVDTVSDEDLSRILNLEDQDRNEAEHPDCLLMISPAIDGTSVELPSGFLERVTRTDMLGQPNRLSKNHHPWTVIDEVSEATKHWGGQVSHGSGSTSPEEPGLDDPVSSQLPARQLFRRRRSAVAMDPSGSLSRVAFLQILRRLVSTAPFHSLPWQPQVSLLFFIHRVQDLRPGVYLLVRNSDHLSRLRNDLREEFLWEAVEHQKSPGHADFYLLEEGDCRNAAKIFSCHQSIAADSVFSLGMLACFEPVLREQGPTYYRRLHWECGLIGQLLYLEAEAAGVRGTGIGCFHDDVVHEFLGLKDRTWQTLYHFTVGKALEDFRLQTIPAYEHL
jgi:SagB-type dehydrogenase family enzyme